AEEPQEQAQSHDEPEPELDVSAASSGERGLGTFVHGASVNRKPSHDQRSSASSRGLTLVGAPASRAISRGGRMVWDVAGLGNALVDALVVVDDDALVEELQLTRGTMHPVDHVGWQK